MLTNLSRRERRALGRADAPARVREPGRGLVNAGMALLGLLDAGLLYVVYAAQYAFIFSQKHEHTAAQVQALALDAAMIIFSVLALGLARKGLGAPAERAAIVVCAAASAFMNWTAADQASLRSVAVFVAAPILLALTTDRTISVVRRHVLGMKDDASPWAKLGRALARLALYTLRAVVDLKGTRRGVKAAILAAAPLPEAEPGRLDVDHFAVLREELATGLDRIRETAREELAALDVDGLRADSVGRGGPARPAPGAAWSWPPGPAPTRPRRPTSWPCTAPAPTTASATRPEPRPRPWPRRPGSRPARPARTCTRNWPSASARRRASEDR